MWDLPGPELEPVSPALAGGFLTTVPPVKPIFFMCCWIQFANILLRIFASIFIKDIGLSFSFFGGVFVWFWYQSDGGFIKCLWEFSLLFIFLEEFEKDWYKFFFVCLVEFTCEAMWSWILFVESFKITDSISHLVISLFKLSISS